MMQNIDNLLKVIVFNSNVYGIVATTKWTIWLCCNSWQLSVVIPVQKILHNGHTIVNNKIQYDSIERAKVWNIM